LLAIADHQQRSGESYDDVDPQSTGRKRGSSSSASNSNNNNNKRSTMGATVTAMIVLFGVGGLAAVAAVGFVQRHHISRLVPSVSSGWTQRYSARNCFNPIDFGK